MPHVVLAETTPSSLSDDPVFSDSTLDPTLEFAELEFPDVLAMVIAAATKEETNLYEAPAVVDVISAADLRRWGFRTVGQALEMLGGISTSDDLVALNVGIRGTFAATEAASDILKVMINGQPVAFRSSSANFFEHDLIPIELIQRIEVVLGPASALYGANALLGVVNIVTVTGDEKPATDGFQTSSTVLGDSYFTTKNRRLNGGTTLTTQGRKGDVNYVLGATFNYADRSGLAFPGASDARRAEQYQQSPSSANAALGFPTPGWTNAERIGLLKRGKSANDLGRTGSFYGQVMVKQLLGWRGTLVVDGQAQYADRFGEFQGPSTLTHGNRITDTNGFLRTRYERHPSAVGGLFMTASLALAGGNPTRAEHLLDPQVATSYARRKIGYRAVDVAVETGYKTAAANSVRFGADYTYDHETLQTVEWRDIVTEAIVRPASSHPASFQDIGLYGQLLWRPVEGLSVTAGARADHSSRVACDSRQWNCIGKLADQTVAPDPTQSLAVSDVTIANRGFAYVSSRIGVVYQQPWGASVGYVKLLYGTSFKPPSPYQLHHESVTLRSTRGYSDLRSQTANDIELVLGTRLGTHVEVEIDGYRTHVDNLTAFFIQGGALSPRNLTADLWGVEARLVAVPSQGWVARASAGWVVKSTLTPERRADETEAAWKLSPFSTPLEGVRQYPAFRADARVAWQLPRYFMSLGVGLRYVSERRASLVNGQIYSPLDLNRSYAFSSYLSTDVTLQSEGLKLFGDAADETRVALSWRGFPGSKAEPGHGGVDIPTLGPQLSLQVGQQF